MHHFTVNLNGKMVAPDQPHISIFDRGFLYGDSLYEVVRTYGQKPYQIAEHLDRLQKSAQLCHMELSQSIEEYDRQIQTTIAEHLQQKPLDDPSQELYCRLIVTRGTGKIGFGKDAVQSPTQYVVMVQTVSEPPQADLARGLDLALSSRQRNDRKALDPAMKSGNYLNNLLAFIEAKDQGRDDAILCNTHGFVTEGTTFNVFYRRKGVCATPPLDAGILVGLTRATILDIMDHHGWPCRQVDFTPDRLFDADEIFITGTVREVFPVTRIDGKKIGAGKPGKFTMELRDLFRQWARLSAQPHAGKKETLYADLTH